MLLHLHFICDSCHINQCLKRTESVKTWAALLDNVPDDSFTAESTPVSCNSSPDTLTFQIRVTTSAAQPTFWGG